jgi:hypothetical protein
MTKVVTQIATEEMMEDEVLNKEVSVVIDDAADFLGSSVPTIEKELPKPDAHQATITGATYRTFDSGATALQIGLNSIDEGWNDQYSIFLPKGFVENVLVDPTTLPTNEVDPNTGKIKNQQRQYASIVANSAKSAQLQTFFRMAQKQGQVSTIRPTDFEAFVDKVNEALTGIQVIFTRQAQGGDGPFSERMRVNKLSDIEHRDNPKFFKGYRKAWEV